MGYSVQAKMWFPTLHSAEHCSTTVNRYNGSLTSSPQRKANLDISAGELCHLYQAVIFLGEASENFEAKKVAVTVDVQRSR